MNDLSCRTVRSIPAALALIFLVGCGTSGVQRYSPVFDYSPPVEAKPGSADVTFAVVGAVGSDLIPTLQQFGQNMAQDFYEILTAHGYTVRGPFRTYDDMTFPDKKGSDLVLIPDLQIIGNSSGIRWSQSFGVALLGGTAFTGEGSLVVSGRVNLVVAESLSREKMWTKSVDIPPITIVVEETAMYSNSNVPLDVLMKEDGIYNDVAKALEAQYKTILARAYQYLDPEEMRIVKKQAQEIRSKKVY